MIFLLLLMLGQQPLGPYSQLGQPTQGTTRNAAMELQHGQAILRPRFDKDEAAFKALSHPSDEEMKAEHNMQLCFSKARSTEGMYNIPAGKGMHPNCDTYFAPLEKLLKESK